MRYSILLSILTIILVGCSGVGIKYYDLVQIIDGPYRGKTGNLIGDCDGIENYKVRIDNHHIVCVRSWNMEKI
jgi:hypothetical protein